MREVTIATISEAQLGWGAILLVASLRRAGMPHRVEVFTTDKAPGLKELLAQFGNVGFRLFDMGADRRNPCLRKPEALLDLDSEYIAWFDNDCMAVGNIAPYLMPLNGEFQIRMRGVEENAYVFRRYYERGETHGPVPRKILAEWQRDVGEAAEPRVMTKGLANCIILHHRHRSFLERWQRQNDKVFPRHQRVKVVDRSRPAYFMTDESVLSSLLAFGHDTPPISEYRLDKDPTAFLAHLSLRPKPWVRWQWRHWRHYEEVQAILGWCQAQGMKLPSLPSSFRRRLKVPHMMWSVVEHYVRGTKRTVLR